MFGNAEKLLKFSAELEDRMTAVSHEIPLGRVFIMALSNQSLKLECDRDPQLDGSLSSHYTLYGISGNLYLSCRKDWAGDPD